jgi:hypothetical protein
MIIGIGHRKGMGKDTFAQMLLDELNGNLGDDIFYYKESFADRVKAHAFYMFSDYGLKCGEYYDAHRDEKESTINGSCINKTPRDIYIAMGLFGRDVDPEYWIKQVIRSSDQNLIIPDLRYPNEMKRIKALGGLTIRVINPRVEITHDEADDALEGYDFDCVVENNGTLVDLREQAKIMVQCIANLNY